MAAVANPVITEEEYLALAETSEAKLEYVGGRVRPVGQPEPGGPEMMAGGSLEHSTIAYNAARAFGLLAEARRCRGFTSDVWIKVKATGEYVYPDLAFTCRKAEREGLSLLNPTLVVEVLSPSTAAYDRDEKLELYRSIPSVEEYVLIGSEEVRAERYRRHGEVWLYESVRGRDASIEVLGDHVRLADLYRDIELPEAR